MFFPEARIRVQVYGCPVDMRQSFDGLIALTRHALREDPVSGQLFVFFNRRSTLVKVLYWDRPDNAKSAPSMSFTPPPRYDWTWLSRPDPLPADPRSECFSGWRSGSLVCPDSRVGCASQRRHRSRIDEL
ncbi:IS66 family insertion sequence element accessory protein TnpB [Accumulibacter sp.]|uniref:IS66 family insertion sequence element accessory protein TnpB n=2 Tax=Accumulibacter sp. TaxID=2053492 RepID=UPI0035AE4EFF